MDILDLVLKLKIKLSTGIENSFSEFELLLNSDSKKFNEYIILKGRFNKLNKLFLNALISPDDYNLELNKLNNSFVLLIQELEEKDFKEEYANIPGIGSQNIFRNYVISLFEKRGYFILDDIEYSDKRDFIAIKREGVFGELRYLVRCVIDYEKIVSFEEIAKGLINNQKIHKGIIVYEKKEGSISLSSNNINIINISLEELENELFNVEEELNNFIENYENSDIFSDFIKLEAEVNSPFYNKSSIDIEDEIVQLILKGRKKFISILGDFGSGKSTMITRIKYIFAKKNAIGESRIIPILFLLKEYYKFEDLQTFILATIRRELHRDVPISLFWKFVEEKKILILLDGFDEMASKADVSKRKEFFFALSRFFISNSFTILTCRPTYFVTPKEFEEYVNEVNKENKSLPISISMPKGKIQEQKKEEIIEFRNELANKLFSSEEAKIIQESDSLIFNIKPFDKYQIDKYLEKFNDQFLLIQGKTWEEVKDFLLSIYDLSDLMSRPILLNMIKESALYKSEKLNIFNYKTIGPSTLYEIYTTLSFERDWGKGKPRQFLSMKERLEFTIAIAMGMYQSNKLEITHSELLELIKKSNHLHNKKLSENSIEEISTDIRTCSFLSVQEDKVYKFSHKSFMEFFVALQFKKSLENNHTNLYQILEDELPREIVYFFGGFGVVDDNLYNALNKHLDYFVKINNFNTSKLKIYKRNITGALLLASTQRKFQVIQDVNLNNLDFVKLVFNNLKLNQVSFVHSKWREIHSQWSSFRDVIFNNCEIHWTPFKTTGNISFLNCNQIKIIAKNSKFSLEHKRSTYFNSDFHSCELILTGETDFVKVNFVKTKLELPIKFSELVSFNNCTFSDSTIIDSLEHESISKKFRNCKFSNCKIIGIRVDNKELQTNVFEKCEGVIFTSEIIEVAVKNKFAGERIQLFSEQIWKSKEETDISSKTKMNEQITKLRSKWNSSKENSK